MSEAWYGRAILRVVLAMALLFLFFNLFPGVDIRVSSWFFDAMERHWLASGSWFYTFRDAFNTASIGLAVICLILWAVAARRGPVLSVPHQIWGFVPLLYILGPGILVNGIFKAYWGRARPTDVSEFGGSKEFTPPFRLSDQCENNCSFVSGEGSGAAAFFISVLVLSAYFPNAVIRRVVLSLAFVVAAAAAALRVMKGRHFFSDTLYSVLFVCLVALFLHWLLNNEKYLRTTSALWSRAETWAIELYRNTIAPNWKKQSGKR